MAGSEGSGTLLTMTAANPTYEALQQLISSDTEPEIIERYSGLPEQAPTAEYGFEDEVVILDTETTGYLYNRERIIEIALVKMKGAVIIDRYSTLINPGKIISPEITELTSISNEMVADAPFIAEVADEILAFIGECDIVAHNAKFDRNFIENEIGKLSNRWIDSIRLLHIGLPRLSTFSQERLAGWLAPEIQKDSHRATTDTEVLTRVWRVALAGIARVDSSLLRLILTLDIADAFDENRWIQQVLDSRPDRAGKAFNLRSLRTEQIRDDRAEELYDAFEVRPQFSREEEVLSVFDTQEGLEPRPSQRAMAKAVYKAFSQSQLLTIEAATGVGKSLAYLLPAAAVALENNITVGIATRTNTLTDQLLTKEIPRLNELLGTEIRCTALKGYEHYFCLRKVEALLKAPGQKTPGFDYVLSWIAQSPWSDITRMSGARFVGEPAIATFEECNRKRCKYFSEKCYLHGTRKRAKSSHIVVTNHALLFRDAASPSKILPPVRYWIVDEAHGVESEARSQASIAIDPASLQKDMAHQLLVSGATMQITSALAKSKLGKVETEEGVAAGEVLKGALKQLEGFLAGFSAALDGIAKYQTQDANSREVWINPEMRTSHAWTVAYKESQVVGEGLSEAIVAGNKVLLAVAHDSELSKKDAVPELSGFISTLSGALRALEVLFEDVPENYFYWLSASRSFSPRVLGASPLSVGEIIDTQLYQSSNSIIYTSATLAVGDDFQYFRNQVGLNRVETGRSRELTLSSDFDLDEMMRVYVTSDMPDPRSTGYLVALSDFLENIHRASKGGVLTLFTNRNDMEAAYRAVEPVMTSENLTVLVQTRPAANLAKSTQFIQEKETSLFALRSFWEGFDARGDTLSCVVIPKLLFAPPTTPLARERNARFGSSAWRSFDLPEAIINLKQAVGRLIRSADDRGFVVLADDRLISKGYGATILRALPTNPIIATQEQVIEAIQKDTAERNL